MKKLSFILLFLLYCFNTLQADGYVSYHFTNLGGTFNPSLSDEVNICVLDNGTTSNCLDKYPSILSNTYHDNGSISGTSNDVKDNDTRYFDEKIRIGLSTIRLSAGLGANFFEGTIIGIGMRYGFTTGIVSIVGKKIKQYWKTMVLCLVLNLKYTPYMISYLFLVSFRSIDKPIFYLSQIFTSWVKTKMENIL